MEWQEEEKERRWKQKQAEEELLAAKSRRESAEFDAVSGFWKKLLAANKKVLKAVRAEYLQRPLNESLRGSRCGINYKIDLDKGENIISNCACEKKCCCNWTAEISYSHDKKCLFLSLFFLANRVLGSEMEIRDEHVDIILKNICTGKSFWDDLL